ncbi:MAG: hypothetical protein R3F59_22650 [Myxococcota bacterium]
MRKWFPALACVVAACSGSDPTKGTADTSATTTAGSDTATGDTTTVDPGEPSVAGVLVDPAGQPLGLTDVLCCTAATCFTAETDTDGAFAFPLAPGDEIAVKTHPDLYVQPRWTSALVPGVVGDGQLEVGEVYVPDLPAGVALEDGLQTLEPGDGLELTLTKADLTPELGTFLYDVAARRLPEERIPPYPGLGEAVVGVWALHPFATESASPVAVAVPVDLPDGAEVHVRAVSHLDGTLSAPAVAHVADGVARTDAGQGVTLLTHLVVSTP